MGESNTERRAHARLERTLDLEGLLPGEGQVVPMRVRNLSVGGLYCTSTVDFPEMTRLEVRLMLPPKGGSGSGPAPLDVEAVVVRRRVVSVDGGAPRFELALLFVRMDDGRRERIARLVHGSSSS